MGSVESCVQTLETSIQTLRELGVTKYEVLTAVANLYSESDKLVRGLAKVYDENPNAKDWTMNERFAKILGLESTIFRPFGKGYFCELLDDSEIQLNWENTNTIDYSVDRFYMFEDVEQFEFFRSREEAKRVCFPVRSEEK